MEIVIKVKYGDSLRRFNVLTNGDDLDLNMDRLRSKIIGLFNLQPDSDLILTYIDEDNDTVTLVDDDDLRDAVVTQHLNPLRINVLLKTSRATTSERGSQSGASTPIRSPRVRSHPHPRVSAGVEEAMKSVPEPIRDVLLKFSNDLMSKAATSSPALTELVEYLSKLGQSHLGPLSQGQESAVQSNPTGDQRPNLNIPVVSGASDDPINIPTVFSPISMPTALLNASSVDQIPKNVPKNNDGGNMMGGVGTSSPSKGYSVNANLELPKDSLVSPVEGPVTLLGMSVESDSEPRKEIKSHQSGKSQPDMAHSDPVKDLNPQASEGSELPKISTPQVGSFWVSSSPVRFGPENGYPSNVQRGADSTGSWGWNNAVFEPFKMTYGEHDGFPRSFHRGICCDGCGMHPITGPRFKSKVKEDFDLCNVCFSRMGNDADYIRIDRAGYQTPRYFKEFCNPNFGFRGGPSPRSISRCAWRAQRSKLESRFILDVNVLDGTSMPTGTRFTKIWRMRNDGTVAWPRGTKLVWIGGDSFANSASVDLEIPESGYPVGEELDVAVDFTAPLRPGRYTSYWRMASPSGQRFGQRVWVVIQVENSQHIPIPDSHASLNLNLTPENNREKGKGPAIIIDVNLEPKDGSCPEPESLTPVVNSSPTTEGQKPNFEQVSGLAWLQGMSEAVAPAVPKEVFSSAGGNGAAPQPIPNQAGLVSYPIIDFSELTPATEVSLPPPPPPPGVLAAEFDNYEQNYERTLLKELFEMGFKEMDLNKKILRKNEYDLAQSLDDLCGISEWDPMLEELEEMGFSDREMNKKLLMKNGGSIKRAVMDLIAGEKA